MEAGRACLSDVPTLDPVLQGDPALLFHRAGGSPGLACRHLLSRAGDLPKIVSDSFQNIQWA